MSDVGLTLITDDDVLAVIAKDDQIATEMDAAFGAAASKVSAAALLAWQGDLAAYHAWAAPAVERLQGGFFGGQWFGVPDAYNAAINWGARLKSHAADLRAAGADVPASLPELPPPSTPATATAPTLGGDTKILIGLGLVALILIARKL